MSDADHSFIEYELLEGATVVCTIVLKDSSAIITLATNKLPAPTRKSVKVTELHSVLERLFKV